MSLMSVIRARSSECQGSTPLRGPPAGTFREVKGADDLAAHGSVSPGLDRAFRAAFQ